MVSIDEPIDVWVLFKTARCRKVLRTSEQVLKNNLISPHLFFWNNRQIKISKINLIHTSTSGSATFYHFSVSSEENFYRLKFDLGKVRWFLEAVEEGS